jgi:hypothetical protein
MTEPQKPDLSRATDPQAYLAIMVAGLLGIPAALFVAVEIFLAVMQYGLCGPDYTCGGLPGDDAHVAWMVDGVGFAGPAFATLVLDKIGQRRARWICAVASVAIPVLTLVAVISLSKAPGA